MSGPAAILDIDGTLVDSNYQHTIAWYRALRQHDQHVAIWRIHRHIGMGGDQLVAALCGDEVEERLGDDIRAAEKALYMALIDEVEPLHGARDLIVDLKRLGRPVVLASSAKPDEIDHYLDLLDARGLADAWTSAGDVEQTKPAPGPRRGGAGARRRRARGDGRRLDVGLPRGRQRGCRDDRGAHRRLLRARAARRGGGRRLRVDRRAAAAAKRHAAGVGRGA